MCKNILVPEADEDVKWAVDKTQPTGMASLNKGKIERNIDYCENVQHLIDLDESVKNLVILKKWQLYFLYVLAFLTNTNTN